MIAQAPPARQRLGTEFGISAFERECTKCHGNAAVERAPTPAAIRQMAPERIYAALTTGVMKTEAANLTDEQKRRLAEYMGGRPLGSAALGDANQMPNHCPADAALPDPSKSPAWNGWGVDAHNTRFQNAAAAGITAAQVPGLKLKWAFGFPLGVSAFGQPSVAAGRVFVGSDIGYVYSLDMQTGCVYWSYKTKAAVRTAITIGRTGTSSSSRYAVYLGDMQANVYALDAMSGALLWTKHVEDHFSARITAAPTLYKGRLYVPVSTSEGFSASTLDYPCCTFRGSVVALNAATGDQVWKAYTIPEPKPIRKNSIGTQLYAPSGVAVWNSPTVDAKRHAIYFGDGDSATEPAPDTSDSILAVDMNTGKLLWHFQAEPNDATLGGCFGKNKTENCPENPGPDWDFGASPILKTLPGGRDLLLAPNKSGIVFALDPDREGAVVWKTNLAEKQGTRNTNLVWGGSADRQNLYIGLVTGAMTAVQISTGEKLWTTRLAPPGSRISYAAASSAIPGCVFIGGTDGKVHALASTDGHELWSFDTARDFTTVNQVPAHGGSIGSIGPTIAGGMVFIGSGYSVTSGIPGNVLLAFAPK
ncbi:MAG TPA: PQQ-binding-like beta-propeller repeat protein [Bryobacteraceae bacterium]|nr:PQQ-binding-like beta-propeller repeat protein [Bryobacteraceae bacterium]